VLWSVYPGKVTFTKPYFSEQLLLTFGDSGWYTSNESKISPQGGGWKALKKVQTTMTHLTNDPTREDIAKRLARVAGHANSLKRLWDEGRECDDMLTQIAAVRAGLDQVGKAILEHHIEHCVTMAVKHGEAEEAIRDLKAALDRFV
jgi:DNA-binding FrmR family transcriptional regulator